MKVRVIRGSAGQVQQAAWPSLDQPVEGRAPAVPLPKEPRVELVSQPDGAHRIIVTCTCGKRIEITCES
ncbi:MAG: hypothetical protein HY360_06730 [Verrucomicrobia bacterium]|nr:hypothetical protein [Verrucomicrobiota bacterium]